MNFSIKVTGWGERNRTTSIELEGIPGVGPQMAKDALQELDETSEYDAMQQALDEKLRDFFENLYDAVLVDSTLMEVDDNGKMTFEIP